MLVSRSEVSLRCSIHRESCVTGAKAMSASLVGSATARLALRTNRSRTGPGWSAASIGFHRVAGADAGSMETLLGPVRRSSSGAIDFRQLSTAIARSELLIETCASFSASAKVEGETAGPAPGAVPNVGGAPGVDGGD